MKILLLGSSLASLAVLASAAYRENFHGQWRSLQHDYQRLLELKASDDTSRQAAARFTIGHKQLFLKVGGKIDRCTSCHLGVQNPAMVDAEKPFGRHPGAYLVQHPIDKFGCTMCHQGQGRAMTAEAAHGWREDGSLYPHAEHPLLRGGAVYTSCRRCHDELDLFADSTPESSKQSSEGARGDSRTSIHRLETGATQELETGATDGADTVTHIDPTSLASVLPGAKVLAEGKRLVVQRGCLGCHKYRGRGGTLGPDLTYVGDKNKHDFDFAHVKGEHTVEQWLFEHFMIPTDVSPGTRMPDMGLSPSEARSLALYMMSLHQKNAPASLLPRSMIAARVGEGILAPAISAPPTRGGATSVPRAEIVPGETLFKMFCSACHGAEGFGSTMRAGLWPRDVDPWGRTWQARDIS